MSKSLQQLSYMYKVVPESSCGNGVEQCATGTYNSAPSIMYDVLSPVLESSGMLCPAATST